MLAAVNLIGACCATGMLQPLSENQGKFATAYIITSLSATIDAFVEFSQTKKAGKTLEDIQKKLAELKEKNAQHSSDLAQIAAS